MGDGLMALLFPPLLSSAPFLSLLPLPFAPLLPLEVGPLNPARESEGAVAPQRGVGQSPSRSRVWCILALKYDIWW